MVRVSALEVRSIQDKKVYMLYVLHALACLSTHIPHSAFDIASPDRNRSLEIDFENALKTFSNSVNSLPLPAPSPAAAVLASTPTSAPSPLSAPKVSTNSTDSAKSVSPEVRSGEPTSLFSLPSSMVPLVESLWSVIPITAQGYFATTSPEDKAFVLLALFSLTGLSLPFPSSSLSVSR
jgi:hypothetical protein